MAIAKKGFRKIAVEGREFYWRFSKQIFVIPKGFENSLLIVDFGWFDSWLYVNDKKNRPADFEPKIVTPHFVRESITYALNQGWSDGKMEVEFRSGEYKKK